MPTARSIVKIESLASLMGTEYQLATHDKILFLEDVNEKPYKIDRLLHQLFMGGLLKGVTAIVLGDFSSDEALCAARNYLTRIDKPVFYEFPFGHIESVIPIPIGGRCDIKQDTIVFTLPKKWLLQKRPSSQTQGYFSQSH